jgi:hypothetical protein
MIILISIFGFFLLVIASIAFALLAAFGSKNGSSSLTYPIGAGICFINVIILIYFNLKTTLTTYELEAIASIGFVGKIAVYIEFFQSNIFLLVAYILIFLILFFVGLPRSDIK